MKGIFDKTELYGGIYVKIPFFIDSRENKLIQQEDIGKVSNPLEIFGLMCSCSVDEESWATEEDQCVEDDSDDEYESKRWTMMLTVHAWIRMKIQATPGVVLHFSCRQQKMLQDMLLLQLQLQLFIHHASH